MGLLIAANREPIRRQENGSWEPSVGGLTSALLPVLEERGGAWIAWGEGEEEDSTISYPSGAPAFEVDRLALGEEQIKNYYYGFANRILWPLCHYFNEQMDIQHVYWDDYQEVNRRFADAIAKRADDDTVIWVHDYHLLLTPAYVRERVPDARVGFFFHIPFPALEEWSVLPWAAELTKGLLGADLIGFHTHRYCENFLSAAGELPGAAVEGNTISYEGREIRVEPHPIGIATDRFVELAGEEETRQAATQIREETGAEFLILGVDRLDYTKGVPERLLGFEHFLENHPEFHGRVTFHQISAPSRTRIESYQELKRTVDEIAGRINGTYMQGEWVPVRYLYRSHTQEELVAHYLAADAMLVTPFRDGMNVVALEFTLTSESGILVLSHMTGAAEELDAPLLVNPYDIVSISDAIAAALKMERGERRDLMAPVRRQVEELDVHLWSKRFLESLERS